MIVRTGPRTWELRTRDGSRVLGRHPSYQRALAQERAVEASKHRRGRRNPASVPLDIYEEQLSKYQNAASAEVQTEEEYRGIRAEIVRGMGERVGKMERDGLFDLAGDPVRRGVEVGKLVREFLAASFATDLITTEAFRPGVIIQTGRQRMTPAELRARDEAMAVSFETWAEAVGRYLARPDVRGAAFAPEAEIRSAARSFLGAIMAFQAKQSSQPSAPLWNETQTLRETLAPFAGSMLGEAYGRAVDGMFTLSLPSLRSAANAAVKLASKGPPKVSRKISSAEENRLAALERGEVVFPDEWIDKREGKRYAVAVKGSPESVVARDAEAAVFTIQNQARPPKTGWAPPYKRIPITAGTDGRTPDFVNRKLPGDLRYTVLPRALFMGAVQRAGIPLARMFSPEAIEDARYYATSFGIEL